MRSAAKPVYASVGVGGGDVSAGGSGGGGTRRLVAAVFPVRSMPTSYSTFEPGVRSVAEPSVSLEMWKNTSLPPLSGRMKPNPLSSKYLTIEPVCSPEVHEAPSELGAAWPEEGRLVLSPTPCLSKAKSDSVRSFERAFSVGILRLGFFLWASSNSRFCIAFKRYFL